MPSNKYLFQTFFSFDTPKRSEGEKKNIGEKAIFFLILFIKRRQDKKEGIL
jgi:hypothetical protein